MYVPYGNLYLTLLWAAHRRGGGLTLLNGTRMVTEMTGDHVLQNITDLQVRRIEVEPATAPDPEATAPDPEEDREDPEVERGGATASEEAVEATEDGSTRLPTGKKTSFKPGNIRADSTRLSLAK
jgi:hypothetical protein